MKKSEKPILIMLLLAIAGVLLISQVSALSSYQTSTNSVYSSQVIQTSRIYLHDDPDALGQQYVTRNYYNSFRNYNYGYPVVYNENGYNIGRVYTSGRIADSYTPIRYVQRYTQQTRKSFLGDYVKEYSVYVRNTGVSGRYFTVKYTLDYANGNTFSQMVTQYVKAGENKKFLYKTSAYERNEILSWSYKITPLNY